MFVLVSCAVKPDNVSPLETVIKLKACETLVDFENAKEFIDLDRVYGPSILDTASAENVWREQHQFAYNLARDNKFTNVFNYSKYKITQLADRQNYKVIFEALNSAANFKSIEYLLEPSSNSTGWKVVGVKYTPGPM